MSDSLKPRGLQYARLPCSSPSPGACSNSCPLSWWCHPTILSSVFPFSSCHQSFPESGFFHSESVLHIRWPNIGPSASASVLPMTLQDWFPLGWTSWISLQSKGISRVSPTPQFKSISSSVLSFLYSPILTSYMTTGKTIALIRWTFVGKVMSLLFNMLSGLIMEISRQEYWSDLPFPSPVDHILSDLSTMTHTSWVVLYPWLGFIELDKAVVHVIRLVSFLWLCFQSVCPLMPSLSTYNLTGVSLTLDEGYLFTAAPEKHSCRLTAPAPWEAN